MALDGDRRRHRRRPRDRRQRHRQIGQLVGRQALEHGRPALAQMALQGLAPQRERNVALQLGRPSGHHGVAALRGPTTELAKQPRLADPRLTDDPDRKRSPALHDLERAVEHPQLRVTPDQHASRAPHSTTVPARTGPGAQLLPTPNRAPRRSAVGSRARAMPGPDPSRGSRWGCCSGTRIATGNSEGGGQGSSVNAAAWFGRTTLKWRRSTVAMSVTPSRSAVATTDASTVPSGRSR